MAEQSFQERTEQATPRRRLEARREGQVARSREVANAIVLLALTAVFSFYGPTFFTKCRDLLVYFFGNMGTIDLSSQGIVGLQIRLTPVLLGLLAPVALTALFSGLVSNVMQVGFHVSSKPLGPKFDRLDPIKGMKRVVSMDSGVELVKSLVKLVIVGSIAWGVVQTAFSTVLPTTGSALSVIISRVGQLFITMGLRVGLALLILAILDYGYQRYRHDQNIKMTRKEVEEEVKQQEGSPQIKSKVRAQQRRLSWQRMMAAIPKADVVITNPTHYAVALRYDRGKMAAPEVVAKGMRKMALRIREIAEKHNVPIVEDPPLARALHKQTEVGQRIPTALFEAVARILAYVYRLHQSRGVA
ncbi:MAG: flagellar biosynthesis protein FlhB [Candidatus Eisenbacteria bacterium]|uniref:Flagellar biosynthetic protein FlhB n=1 Tax=Eiseniibacteriota bacterium TaxID=2212470 RepID=A0A948W734_UNCEI|nr:flagellar biosynthesis protein FlhB [Candidatus Eisenbacteria bacterium]MBU1950958.1 flagellar biosynthesis protein FlhB [Candidatus Eisenbacteria bacterium]MBU2692169.1 flagellar biosynthesis protein FlhB [Candidatus Eisenbacteria bacterium]